MKSTHSANDKASLVGSRIAIGIGLALFGFLIPFVAPAGSGLTQYIFSGLLALSLAMAASLTISGMNKVSNRGVWSAALASLFVAAVFMFQVWIHRYAVGDWTPMVVTWASPYYSLLGIISAALSWGISSVFFSKK